MGVYHFAGLGRSIGAVTAAFSYLAARKQLPGAEEDPLFDLSGQADLAPAYRGAVQALVLFSTAEVLDGSESHSYLDNPAGIANKHSPRSGKVLTSLKAVLQQELAPLARRESMSGDLPGRPTGPFKPVELYLCEVDPTHPVETFERAVQCMWAAKPPGHIGHEIWINLTGGSNIINSALQLAASLTGAPARQYYLLSENTGCIRHTMPPARLGSEHDNFWVDVPMTFLGFSPQHVDILEFLAEYGESISESELGALTGLVPDPVTKAQMDMLRHTYLRPLEAQRLLLREQDEQGNAHYQIGSAWERTERYFKVLDWQEDERARSLGTLAREVTWLRQGVLEIA